MTVHRHQAESAATEADAPETDGTEVEQAGAALLPHQVGPASSLVEPAVPSAAGEPIRFRPDTLIQATQFQATQFQATQFQATPFQATQFQATLTRPVPAPVAEPGHVMPQLTVTVGATHTAPFQTGTVEREPSASRVAGHLLIEDPGPWTGDPLAALPARAAEVLSGFCTRSGVRPLLGRLANRPGRRSTISVVLSVPDNEGLAITRSFDSAADLTDVPWDAIYQAATQARVPGDWTEAEPFLAIDGSTGLLHGARLENAMAAMDPDNVWVTSALPGVHGVPVLALPTGLLYASLSPADAADIVEAHWQFRVLLPHLVGRLRLSLPEQVAERALRLHLDADAEDAVTALESRQEHVTSETHGDEAVTITRFVTTWTVYPVLVRDPVLARMMPDLRRQPVRTWRVVVDQIETLDGRPRLTVVEVAEADSAVPSATDWDGIHAGSSDDRVLPDPAVVAVAGGLPTGRVLDLGCGAGRNSLWFAEHGWDVTAVDFSRSGLSRLGDAAADRGLRIRAELADVRLWAPPAGAFDVVLAADLEIPDLVAHAARWVAPGGRLVLVGSADSAYYDHVALAARATAARLRVLRAHRSTTTSPDGTAEEQVVLVALRAR